MRLDTLWEPLLSYSELLVCQHIVYPGQAGKNTGTPENVNLPPFDLVPRGGVELCTRKPNKEIDQLEAILLT